MPPSPDRRPWSMARELHAARAIMREHGVTAVELVEAIGALREVRPGVRRLTALHEPGLFADALQAARAARARAARSPDAPRSLVDILRTFGVAVAVLAASGCTVPVWVCVERVVQLDTLGGPATVYDVPLDTVTDPADCGAP